jgi:hypothetical protein
VKSARGAPLNLFGVCYQGKYVGPNGRHLIHPLCRFSRLLVTVLFSLFERVIDVELST